MLVVGALCALAVASCAVPGTVGGANYLGTGNELAAPMREGFRLSVGSRCSPREQGDPFMSRADNTGAIFASCSPGEPSFVRANPMEGDGYTYRVDVPEGFADSLGVQVYDAPWCPSFAPGGDSSAASGTPHRFTFTVSSAWDDVQLASTTLDNGDCAAWGSTWRDLLVIAEPAPAGTYFVVVRPEDPADTTVQQGGNQFGLRLTRGGAFAPCSADPLGAAPFDPLCPTLWPSGPSSVAVDLPTSGSSFPVARTTAADAGATLTLRLFDVGDSASSVSLLDPAGNPVPVTWTVLCQDLTAAVDGVCSTGETPPSFGYGPFSGNSAYTGSGITGRPQPWPDLAQTTLYNDRMLAIEAPIDADPEAYGGAGEWRLRFATNGVVQADRLMWQASVG